MTTYPETTYAADTITAVYDELAAILGNRQTRRIQHNTTLRREGTSLVIRYHATDVITYHDTTPRTVELRANGWHTSTTAHRFSRWLPYMWSVSNHGTASRWYVWHGTQTPDGRRAVAGFEFWDGMTLRDEPRPFLVNFRDAPDFPAADVLAADIRARIRKYANRYDGKFLASLTDTNNPSALLGDCLYCQIGTTDDGHLLAHITEGYAMGSVILNAYSHRGYGTFRAQLDVSRGDTNHVRQTIRKYLEHVFVPYGQPTITRETLDTYDNDPELVHA